MAVKFLTQEDGKGWTICQRTRDSQWFSLPHYLKVNYLRTTNNRDYFIPYESTYANTEFSAALNPKTGSSYLVDGQHLPGATVIFNPQGLPIYGTELVQVKLGQYMLYLLQILI